MCETRGRAVRLMLAVGLTVLVTATACGGDDDTASSGDQVTLRLGYFPNVTHATAIVGDRKGIFARHLGKGVELKTSFFDAGPAATEALLSGAIDAAFLGPNPAINAYAQSKGEAVRLVSGATSGGAFLVVKPEITSPEDLESTKLATPQLGNTQDVALRAYLKDHDLTADPSGGGDVSILPQANADTLTAFTAGDIDGAWVPEPWATRLILEGKGKILVDERDLWPQGRFVTTHLLVTKDFLDDHPDVVKDLLAGVVETTNFVNDHLEDAQRITNEGIGEIAGKPIAEDTLAAAWKNLTFTWDPIAPSLQKSKDDAVSVDLLEEVDIDDIYDLRLLNEVLDEAGEDPVEGLS